jgi:hypothetical protein
MSRSRSKTVCNFSREDLVARNRGDEAPRPGLHTLQLLQGTKPKPKAEWAVRLLPLTEAPIQEGWRNILAWGAGEPYTLHLKVWSNPWAP